MNTHTARPSWWQLWLLFPVLAILAYVDVNVSMSPLSHRAVEIGIVPVLFGLVEVWLRANAAARPRETDDRFVWPDVENTVGLPFEPGAICGRNGHGHESAWILPGRLPEIDAVYGDREEETE